MWRFLLLDFPLAALLASVAMRTANGQGVVPHWRRRVAVVLVVLVAGLFWWTCSLLVYTPWGRSRPDLRGTRRADFSLSHRYGIMGPYPGQPAPGYTRRAHVKPRR